MTNEHKYKVIYFSAIKRDISNDDDADGQDEIILEIEDSEKVLPPGANYYAIKENNEWVSIGEYMVCETSLSVHMTKVDGSNNDDVTDFISCNDLRTFEKEFIPVINSGDKEAVFTLSYEIIGLNLSPVANTFTINIDKEGLINFSSHIDDAEDADSSLKIKLRSLPNKGELTVSGASASLYTEYGISVLKYTAELGHHIVLHLHIER